MQTGKLQSPWPSQWPFGQTCQRDRLARHPQSWYTPRVCGLLALLFLVVPAIEIYLIVVVGGVIGPAATLAIVAVTAVVGAALARRQGLEVLRRLQESMATGRGIERSLAEGALVLVAGVLLLTPGFATDAVGLALLAPPVRRWAAGRILQRARRSSRIVFVPMASSPFPEQVEKDDPPPPGVIDV